ncbi:MAG: hypothetical protein A2293_04150 [Elusimicrobia bacterium RIFOXYB2_FULL_49_7]|nr:MAG: hypothetical protein A2293_04150 [Elusimicrobia bacterium RIFOXYB2_FULL_49_7]
MEKCIQAILTDTKIEWLSYIIGIIVSFAVIRVILSLFKAWAFYSNEIKFHSSIWRDNDLPFWCYFKISLVPIRGADKNPNVNDYFLPAIIGIFELLSFPILMNQALWQPIAVWLGIKTVASWGGWQKYRAGYNRFLLS